MCSRAHPSFACIELLLGIGEASVGGLSSLRSSGNAAERKDFNVSFFVIIVVIPYLIALAAFLKPYWAQRFVLEWPWEARRASLNARHNFDRPEGV